MKLYTYDLETGLYTGEKEAKVDNIETMIAGRTVYQAEAHATFLKPPEPPEDQSVYFFESRWVFRQNPTLDELKVKKQDELRASFDKASEEAVLTSSLGYKINADSVAKRNIDSLIELMTAASIENVEFCDYDNIFHNISVSELNVLKLEVIQNANSLYQQKWNYRNYINQVETKEDLDELDLVFTNMDFTSKD